MRQVAVVKRKKANYFITNREAFTLWREASYYPKLQIMFGFALFRGFRVGEIRAINIQDFKNAEFNKMDVIIEKSNIIDEFPIFKEFAVRLKEYIIKNKTTFTGGYLFPHYRKHLDKDGHMDKGTANAIFFKFRAKLKAMHNADGSLKYPWISEKGDYVDPKTGKVHYNRHRVGWHSMRRWFETKLWDAGYTVPEIAHMMRYTKVDTVYTYLDCYETWRKETEILEDTFGDLFAECTGHEEGQTKLSAYMEN